MPNFRKKPQTVAAPTLVQAIKLCDQPAFIEAQSRFITLNDARQKVGARLREIELILRDSYGAVENHANRQIDAALRFAETGVTQVPEGGIGGLRDEHLMLRAQAEALDRELANQIRVRDAIVGRLAAECFAANRETHNEILRRNVAALRRLDETVAEEDAFLAALHGLGYDCAPPDRACWLPVGTLDDSNSLISLRLREMCRFDTA